MEGDASYSWLDVSKDFMGLQVLVLSVFGEMFFFLSEFGSTQQDLTNPSSQVC